MFPSLSSQNARLREPQSFDLPSSLICLRLPCIDILLSVFSANLSFLIVLLFRNQILNLTYFHILLFFFFFGAIQNVSFLFSSVFFIQPILVVLPSPQPPTFKKIKSINLQDFFLSLYMYWPVCHRVHVHVRGQCTGVFSPLPPRAWALEIEFRQWVSLPPWAIWPAWSQGFFNYLVSKMSRTFVFLGWGPVVESRLSSNSLPQPQECWSTEPEGTVCALIRAGEVWTQLRWS